MDRNLRVLFVSGELIAGDLACRLKKEGCDVKLYIEDKSRRDCLDGMVEKTEDWEEEINWVGKDGLIVFDDIGYGIIQDDLRKEGYNVVGGSRGGDTFEKNRQFAQKVFASCGMDVVESRDFTNISSAIKLIEEEKGKWVVKQNGHSSVFTYVGDMEDGSDVINVLNNYRKYVKSEDINRVSLQKKVEGVEVGVGRYFNGNDWVGPIEMNIEHKCLFNGDIGPQTGEMGTVMWYEDNEKNKLFEKTLAKLKPFFQEINFKGDADINCIVSEDRAVPLEATMRFGCPSTQLQAALNISPWKDFLMALAKGEKMDFKFKKKKGVIVSIAIPPFPYKSINGDCYLKDVGISFKEKLTEEEWDNLHFEEVSLKNPGEKDPNFCIAGSNGFIMYVTGSGDDVSEAREKAYGIVKKIIIPKMFYRTDIGIKFIEENEKKLKDWGWI